VLVKVRRQAALPEPDPDHPLSRAELARYGADPKDLDLVEHELSRYGVTVEAKNPTTRSVTAAGPVSAMEQAFGVRLFDVEHLGVRYRGRTGDIYIPRNLDGVVTAVFGLDTRPMIKRIPRRVIHVAASATASAAQRLWFYPAELAQAYQFPKADGSNQVIGILEFEGTFNPSDLQQFWKLGGTSGPVPRVNVVQVEALPPSQANDPDGTGETMLDVEVVAAVCPKAAIRIYVSAFTEKGWVSNLDAALSDKTSPTVISISYSYPEGVQPWTQQAVDEVNESLKELANAGITVCVSSGDDGSSDGEDDGLAHVGFPATSPYVLAVGGTSLNRRTGTEVVWREGTGVRPDGGATGAGVSAMNPRPSWQSAFKDIQSVNPHAPAGRILPDVSANAALNTGYRIYTSGWQTVGGTSAATPLWAALIARLQQLGKKVGFLTPRLYAPTPKTNGQPLGKAACRDVVSGSNASGNAEGYSAGSGFDAASGWGSPNGQKLLNSL
jgi:kumamolisin